MEFKHFRLEAVIRRSSNKRKNERWRKENPRDQLRPVQIQGREFGVLVNSKEPQQKRDIRVALALGGSVKKAKTMAGHYSAESCTEPMVSKKTGTD